MSTTIVVLYHSSHGSVEAMAHEIAESIEQQGATALLRTFVAKNPHDIVISKDDLIQCDGLAFGTPTRFGMMASQAKAFWETTSELWLKGQLIDSPHVCFHRQAVCTAVMRPHCLIYHCPYYTTE